MKKYSIYIVLIILIAGLFFIPGIKEKLFPIAEIKDYVQVDKKDYDVELKGINVPSTNLQNLYGNKVVFLNFWGTWCAPCRKEWPSIEALYNSHRDKMDFVLIAMMDKEEDVIKFMKENNYTAPVYIAQSPIGEKLLPKVFPTTFLLDKEGRILQKETATKDWSAESVLKFIDQVTK